MKARLGAALLGVSVLLSACGSGSASSFDTAALDSNDQKASYGIGLNVGRQIADTRDRLDLSAFTRGISDALHGVEPAVTQEELQSVLSQFSQDIQAAAAEERARQGEENTTAGQAYLTENGARPEVTTTESGLQYEVLAEGEGDNPDRDDSVRLHYRGTLVDGTEFDTSYDGDPVVFGVGALIPGFTEALTLMRPGSHFRIAIPSDIAYGPNGPPSIGPNQTLIFEIELIEIVE